MQAILAIIQTDDSAAALERLNTLHLPHINALASQGSFLRQGNTTLWMAAQDDQVAAVLEALRDTCHRRTHYLPVQLESAHLASAFPVEVEIGGATVFIGPIERFEVL